MSASRLPTTFKLTQSNSIVGTMFVATIVMSDLAVNDIIRIPSAYYSLVQSDCSANCVCNSNGNVMVQGINNNGTNLTLLTVNLYNVGYVGSSAINLTVYDGSGIFSKQSTIATISTQSMNALSINGSQANPYFT